MDEEIMDYKAADKCRAERTQNCIRIFRWFVAINFLILLAVCSYALYGLYQLASAVRSNEEAMKLEQPFDNTVNISAPVNNSGIMSDFRDLQNLIWQGIQKRNQSLTDQHSMAQGLSVLLNSVGNVMRNYANSTTNVVKSKLDELNQVDFEIRLSQEFNKLTMRDKIRTDENV